MIMGLVRERNRIYTRTFLAKCLSANSSLIVLCSIVFFIISSGAVTNRGNIEYYKRKVDRKV